MSLYLPFPSHILICGMPYRRYSVMVQVNRMSEFHCGYGSVQLHVGLRSELHVGYLIRRSKVVMLSVIDLKMHDHIQMRTQYSASSTQLLGKPLLLL